jgi:hypothetical protein
MSEEKTKFLWEVMGATVRGASHVRSNLLNQDSIDWWPKDQAGSAVCLAVSDGHGSAKSFRSDVGSKFAVDIALDVLRKFADGLKSSPDSLIKDRAQGLPKDLVQLWMKAVESHYREQSFTPEEEKKLGPRPEVAYGATLVTVLVSESYILYLQLGDGDILTVSASGQVARPLESDKRLFANETTSLCLPKAWDDFRFGFQKLPDRPPALILVSTDGYSNSFRDEEAFKKVGSDILTMMCAPDGIGTVKGSIASWLQEATVKGSGDDISLGIIYRQPLLGPSSAADDAAKVEGEPLGLSEEVVAGTAMDPNAPAPDKLREIIRSGVLEDRIRREGMLSDMFREKGQKSVLQASLKQRIPQSLQSQPEVPLAARLAELTSRLRQNAGLSEENARWAVDVWAEALGLTPSGQAQVLPGGGVESLASGANQPVESTGSSNPMEARPAVAQLDTAPSPFYKTKDKGSAAPARSPIQRPPEALTRPSNGPIADLFQHFRRYFSSGTVEQVVAADGSGQFQTIGDAIKAARPKTRLLVSPGIYRESLIIKMPLEIIGQGTASEIVIESGDASPLVIHSTYALVKGLTLRCNAGSSGTGSPTVDASLGKLRFEDCNITSDSLSCLAIHGQLCKVLALRCHLSASRQSGVLIFDDGEGRLEECQVFENSLEGVHVQRGKVVLRDCRIYKNGCEAVRVDFGHADVENCDLSGNARGAWKIHPQHATVNPQSNKEN